MDMVILGSKNREFFMSDIVQGCIIKYSQQEKKAVKIQSLEYMKPMNTPIKINGHFLYLHFGVTGLSLVNVSTHCLKKHSLKLHFQDTLYFGTLSSPLYSMDTKTLQIEYLGQRSGTCQAMTTANGQIMYIGILDSSSIISWSISDPMNSRKLVIRNTKLQWTNSLWIYDEFLWMTHNSFHLFANYKQENISFGIHRWKLSPEHPVKPDFIDLDVKKNNSINYTVFRFKNCSLFLFLVLYSHFSP